MRGVSVVGFKVACDNKQARSKKNTLEARLEVRNEVVDIYIAKAKEARAAYEAKAGIRRRPGIA